MDMDIAELIIIIYGVTLITIMCVGFFVDIINGMYIDRQLKKSLLLKIKIQKYETMGLYETIKFEELV